MNTTCQQEHTAHMSKVHEYNLPARTYSTHELGA